MNFTPKLKLLDHNVRPEHRSGWRYAVNSLAPLLCPDGVLTDTFIEASFVWKVEINTARGTLPYRVPWIGFLHNPVNIPEWHEYNSAPQVLFSQPIWQASLPACRGIVTLSRTLASWVSEQVDKPVLSLIHPTEEPSVTFSMDRFIENPRPLLLQVGWWLRRFQSIACIPLRILTPAILEPLGADKIGAFTHALHRELDKAGLTSETNKIERIPYQDHSAFDELLSKNLVFLHLYDSSANNTLVECIVRNTPVVVNRLPSVEEYLGSSYPLYFDSLEEAARKAEDLGRVSAASAYLSEIPNHLFSGQSFCRSFAESSLYASL